MNKPGVSIRLVPGLALALLGVLAIYAWLLPDDAIDVADRDAPSGGGPPQEREAAVVAFCGDCHAHPSPAMFARSDWPREVQQGYEFYRQSGRTDLHVPPIADALAYYRERAPERIELRREENVGTVPCCFTAENVEVGESPLPAVSHLKRAAERPSMLYQADMRSGHIREIAFSHRASPHVRTLCRVDHPAHLEPVDLDADGREELLIADLGSFLPADHNLGRVLWARPADPEGDWEVVVLDDELGRVADVRAADVDGDEDLDLLVAEFGWRESGSIYWLEQRGRKAGIPQFERHAIDNRHGAIHVPVCDLDRDGWIDFVAAISQEHETVDVFFNQEGAQFTARSAFAAREPSYGMSGLELCDLDADGDLDVLLTNGDSFDSAALCPVHSVQWLENQGRGRFVHHELTRLPGAHRALPADLDGDGDWDVVACAFLPEGLRTRYSGEFDGLIWLEQTAPGTFERHALTDAEAVYVALEVGDFDGDGRVDIAAGRFTFEPTTQTPLTILWNDTEI